MTRFHKLIAFGGVLCTAASPPPTQAEFQLRETNAKNADGHSFSLVWSSPAGKSLAGTTGGAACMIALPGPAESWTAKAIRGDGSSVSVTDGWYGTVPFVQVAVDPAKAEGLELDLSVKVTPVSVPQGAPEDYPEAWGTIQAAFLNGSQFKSVPLATAGVTPKGLPGSPGQYRVTYDDGDEIVKVPLASVGGGSADAVQIRHHGATIPMGGVMGGDIWFFAPRRNTLTDTNDSVFITPSSLSPSDSILTRPAFETLSPAGIEAAVTRTKTFEHNTWYERASNLQLGNRFFFWRATQGNTRTGELAVNDHLTDPLVRVRAKFEGYNQTSASPDHFADLRLEGASLPRHQWDGRTVSTSDATVSVALPNPRELTLEHVVSGTASDMQLLDTVELTWTGYPRVGPSGKDVFQFQSAPAPRRITVGGFASGTQTGDVYVIDITDSNNIVRLQNPPVFTGVSGTRAVEFEVPARASRILVQHRNSFTVPSTVKVAETLPSPPQDGDTLKAVFVRDSSTHGAIVPLIATFAGAVVTIDPQAAYNAYNGGQSDPEAIRSAVRDLLASTPSRDPFPYLYLVGHGSLDRRNHMNRQSGPQIPPFLEASEEQNTYIIENPVDFPYGTVVGSDPYEDVKVGRFPAKTTAEVQVIVNRSLGLRNALPYLNQQSRRGLFVTQDIGELIPFVDEYVQSWRFTGRSPERIRVTAGADEAAVRRQMEEELEGSGGGVAFLLYTGHGNFDIWGENPRFLHTSEVGQFRTRGKWPVVATFTCLNAYYASPLVSERTLAEAWVLQPEDGATAMISPVSVETGLVQAEFARIAMEQLEVNSFSRPMTAGEMMLRARTAYMQAYPAASTQRVAHGYLLMGDPAASLSLQPLGGAPSNYWIAY